MLRDLGQEGLATLRQKLGIVLHDGKALIAREVRRFLLQKSPQYVWHIAISKTSSRMPPGTLNLDLARFRPQLPAFTRVRRQAATGALASACAN
jgi:hypothetical protein